jgi:hypothetical protein
MSSSNMLRTLGLGFIGAAIGGWLGYQTFFWILAQGFYALAIPGATLGLGAGLCARRRSMPLALICGLAGLALGIYIEWQSFPFAQDQSLEFFVRHVHHLPSLKLVMLGIGAIAGAFLALGRDRAPQPA